MRSEAKAPLRIALLAAFSAIVGLGLISSSALAATEHSLDFTFAAPGSAGGQILDPKGIAVDQSTGDVFVSDTGNNRISRFDEDGNFILSWGVDVVQSGPSNLPDENEVQSLTVTATGGTFRLGVGANVDFNNPDPSNKTEPLPYNISAAALETALNGLTVVGITGGEFSVSGGPGDATGSTPYVITFEGNYSNANQAPLFVSKVGLTGGTVDAKVATIEDGVSKIEVCKAGLDVCKVGVPGDTVHQMAEPVAIAVDNSGGPSQGDVYVADVGGPNAVEKFDPDGEFVFRTDGSEFNKAFTEFEKSGGVAVDGAGRVYVSSRNGSVILAEDGSFLELMGRGSINGGGLAVEPSGVHHFTIHHGDGFGALKNDRANGGFWEVVPNIKGSIAIEGIKDLALDPSDNTLYVAYSDRVEKYDPSENTVNLQEVFGEGDLVDARAVTVRADEDKTAYVGDIGSDQIKVFLSVIVPDAKTGDATEITTESARIDGLVNPLGEPTTYQFEYVTEEAFEASGFTTATKAPAPAGAAGEGGEELEFSEELTGLEEGTAYRYRISATNSNKTNFGVAKSFTTASMVTIENLFASNVGTSSASVHATINPGGDPTAYQVEYGLSDAYGSVAPLDVVSAGSGRADLKVSLPLQALSPDTIYHYRFVAENVGGLVLSEDKTFRTFEQSNPELPDSRAWEMVSPPDKNGGSIATRADYIRVADDGNAAVFTSTIAFADSHGTNGNGNEYLAKRSSDGWDTHGITPFQIPPEFPFLSSGYVDEFTPDLDRGIFMAAMALESGHPNVEASWNLYGASGLLTPGAPQMQLLSDSVNPVSEADLTPHLRLAGASEDLSHVIFETRDPLTADAIGTDPTLPKLYESVEGEVRLVGILPDESCSFPPCVADGSLAGKGGLDQVVSDVEQPSYTLNTISDDGSRIFFLAPPFTISSPPTGADGPSANGKLGALYMRENGETTTQINVSERTDCSGDPICGGDEIPDPEPDPNGPYPAKFLHATPDGSMVFFATEEQMSDEDTNARMAQNPQAAWDIYRYEVEAPEGERLTLISEDQEPADGDEALSGYVLGTSDDGSYVYFAGWGQLVPGTPSTKELGLNASDMQRYLYVWHEGEVRFVGAGPTRGNWGSFSPRRETTLSTSVTPDGGSFVFTSISNWLSEEAAGFDSRNAAGCQDNNFRITCQQVYVYDFDADELLCASCIPSGELPKGNAVTTPVADDSASGLESQHVNRKITDDGRWAFFSSPDRLVARDTNGRYDAYRYDTTTGRVALLSSGICDCNSYFVESSPSGRDVFLTTREQLVTIDVDNDADLYDARVGGGIAAQNAVPGPQCEGDACQPPAAVPNFPTPSSAGFKGAGNQQQSGKAKAKKRQKARKRKQQRRRAQARKRARRAAHTNRGGAK